MIRGEISSLIVSDEYREPTQANILKTVAPLLVGFRARKNVVEVNSERF